MRRKLLLAVGFLLLWLLPGTLAAQRRGGGGGVRFEPRHRTFVGGTNFPLYFSPTYYGNPYFGMPSFYGYSYPNYGYVPGPPRDSGTYVIAAPPDIPIEKRIVYVPTYLRADPGPSLGETARALRAQKKKE